MNTTITSRSTSIEDAVFDAALSLEDEAEREKFLQQFFQGNSEGLARMRQLLRLSGESSAFFLDLNEHGSVLAKEVLSAEPEGAPEPGSGEIGSEAPGSRIGPYVLIARIGEGGGGVIYEAEQKEPVRRRVALKIIRLGMDTENVIARFAAERQALALMDHPNIAHVFDAGATATGRPYFVMERVSGERITTCCDRGKFGIVERIELFIQVCHAIQHAHQKSVIHRDIKPSNILVSYQDGVPTPKVIDFGIAKATGPDGNPQRAERTMLDQIMGTPAYMSPEQVDMTGIDVDTRSDVYSLGALLHELLGGRPPFDETMLAKAGISEMRRILLEVEPPPLSRRLEDLPPEELEAIASARGEQPARLIARIRGDLDWIVAMALAKDRNRRYQTVNALASDLRRFLSDEPVIARRPGRVYLLSKFVLRNRLVCGFGAAVAISLLTGLGAATVMYFREHDALKEQERLSKVLEKARGQAQARANVSQAAMLLSEGKVDEADDLLRQSPLESIDPSREAAGVFRALGSRNAIQGRWKQALQCFVLLDQANRLDNPIRTVSEGDLLMIAPTLLKGGEQAAFEKFRRETMDRYLPASNSLQAEHILKVCLLTPADKEMLARLAPAAEVCAEGFDSPRASSFPSWEAFAMTLYNFRLGDMGRTLEWAAKTLSFKDPQGPRFAATLCLTAMAKFRSDQRSKAMVDLKNARQMIDEGAQFGLGPTWNQTALGSWFSWVVAEILLDEAMQEMNAGKEIAGPARS